MATKILVIEDESEALDNFLECLEAEGYEVRGAVDGKQGIELALSWQPNLVICDVMMPILDGHGVLNTLRRDHRTALTPFIFLTARVTRQDIRQGMEMGADDYLPKPCTVDELLGAIRSRLTKHTELVNRLAIVESKLADVWSLPRIPELQVAFDFIEAHYRESISLREVAAATGYSSAHLALLTRKLSGKTVHDWIIERRMAEARELLLQTSQSISQIAQTVGYIDSGPFIRQFGRLHSDSPKAWRESNRQSFA